MGIDENGATALLERYARIPQVLRDLAQWVVWRLEPGKDGDLTKVPYQSRGGDLAKSNDPATWSTFEQALEALEWNPTYSGIGFMFKAGGGIFGFDADHQRNPETGEITPEATRWLDLFATYAEVSPSGTGIHAIGYGVLPGNGRKRSPWEVYDQRRFFTFTGDRLDRYPATLAHVNGPLTELYETLEAPAKPAQPRTDTPLPAGVGTSILSDAEIIKQAREQNTAFGPLWDGDTGAYDGDESRADLALCNLLTYWTRCDVGQMDRLFRASGLMRAKWDERRGNQTYGELTITCAIDDCQAVYEPPRTVVVRSRRVDPETGEVIEELDDEPAADDRPVILVDNQYLHLLTDQCLEALTRVPALYQRGGVLVRLRRDSENAPLGIETLDIDALRGMLDRAAYFRRWDAKRKAYLPARPPVDVVRDLLRLPEYPMRALDGIVETPVLRADGSLLDTPGYDAASRLYYDPQSACVVPPIPENPTTDDVGAARALLVDELLGEFPFASAADLAHALALVLTPFLRNLIAGPTPMLLIDAPSPGSGKGILADVALIPAFGVRLGNLGEAGDDPEWRKQITTLLQDGTPLVRIDNISLPLESAALARAITSHIWEDRLLGGNTMLRIPVRCLWVGTGNNVTASTEISRRIVRIRLDSQTEQPWKREGWKHTNPRAWATEHRGELIAAALTLIRAWCSIGRYPGEHPSLGSFEAWADALAAVLDIADVPGFLTNLDDMYEQADDELATWRAFVQIWWETHQDKPVPVKTLITLAHEIDFPLSSNYGLAQNKELGMALRKQVDRVIGDHIIKRAKMRDGIACWRLQPRRVSFGAKKWD